MHKHLKCGADIHAKIKTEAKAQNMFIDDFLRVLIEQYEKQKLWDSIFNECGDK